MRKTLNNKHVSFELDKNIMIFSRKMEHNIHDLLLNYTHDISLDGVKLLESCESFK